MAIFGLIQDADTENNPIYSLKLFFNLRTK